MTFGLYLGTTVMTSNSFFVQKLPTSLRKYSTMFASPSDAIKSYFEYWNVRDMESACALFDQNCIYEDSLYPKVFIGKDSLKAHLFNVASSVPDSFQFKIDEICEDKNIGKVSVRWHVESNEKELPFTRGLSLYTVNKKGLISTGFDIPEPTIKAGSISLGLLKYAKLFTTEPKRIAALGLWILYCWLLFLSDIAPGVNALQLDPNTWLEVKDLSINYWLILPILSPTVSPVVHPMLEGLFNIILAWSGLFAGFMMDGSDDKNNSSQRTNRFLPVVIGMQFLTNAILLPYLFTRDGGEKGAVSPMTLSEKIGESKFLPIIFGAVGLVGAYWAVYGRADDFGSLTTRWESFKAILSSDRLTFSFVVDAIYFSLFQGWLIEDDFKRRTDLSTSRAAYQSLLVSTGKYVPFLGLLAYFLLRPSLRENKDRV